MKKVVSTMVLSLFVMLSFAQTEKTNGTVYISHPYINVVNNSVKAYATQDNNAWSACYADSAYFWISGMDMSKWNTKKQNLEMLNLDFKFFNDVTVKPFGYPDYIAYDKGNDKVVQSWWTWTGTSKKTGKKLVITYVIFDWFNQDGKIVKEGIFGDFSKQFKEEGIKF